MLGSLERSPCEGSQAGLRGLHVVSGVLVLTPMAPTRSPSSTFIPMKGAVVAAIRPSSIASCGAWLGLRNTAEVRALPATSSRLAKTDAAPFAATRLRRNPRRAAHGFFVLFDRDHVCSYRNCRPDEAP